MPRTRINCPNCRQPILADVEQLFDVGVDPTAKQKLLGGAYNLVQCPACGYQGNLATPIVYHDPEKELLISFTPQEIGLPRDEAERIIGSLINQVVNKLPLEKRKAYILQPQTAFTMQGLVERILEKDGITPEMLQAQQQRMELLQKLAQARDPEVRAMLVKQEEKLIDANLFNILRRLLEVASMGGDQRSLTQLSELHEFLLANTVFGREMKAQSDEVEAAINALKTMGRDLTREKLLDLVVNSPTETRMRAYVSLIRPAMDYSFFQILSDQIEHADAKKKEQLVSVREKLLEWTHEIDQQVEQHARETRSLLEKVLASDNIQDAMIQMVQAVDDYFLQEVSNALEEARKQGNLDRIGKLNQILEMIKQANQAPPEVALVEELLEAETDTERRKILEGNKESITPEFLNLLANITNQAQAGEDPELAERIKAVNRLAVRFSMENNLTR